MPSTRKSKRKPKRASRSAPWHQALEPEIVRLVIAPTLQRILQAGVQSRRDLHTQWEATSGCTASSETFSRWLRLTGYDTLFSQVRLVQTPSPSFPGAGLSGAQMASFEKPQTPPASPPPMSGKAPFCTFHKMAYNDPQHVPTQECLVNEDAVPVNEDPNYTPPSRGLTMEQLAGRFPLPVTEGRGGTHIPTFNAGVI